MTKEEASIFYMEACERIHHATSLLHESLYTEDGDDILTEIEDVMSNIKDFRVWVNTELDLIKEISREYEDNRGPF
tara:strand:+ start:1517 stop:1744 length:228 start_codon:yes stop_codon:yes gene_type:complete